MDPITSAIARIDAMFDERDRIRARIDADSRIIWLRAQNAALWTEMRPGMAGFVQIAEEAENGTLARRRRVAELILARRAKFNNFPSVVRKHLREAAECRRRCPHQNTVSAAREAA